MRSLFQGSTLIGIILCAAFLNQSQTPATAVQEEKVPRPNIEPIRVCFLGNSYTRYNNLPRLVQAMARSQGKTFEVAAHTPNSYRLSQHLGDKAAIEKIKSKKWDYVVMQEQSQLPAVNPKAFGQSVLQLAKIAAAQGTKTVLFMTWQREKQPEMAAKLATAYRAAGDAVAAKVAPVGVAWHNLRKTSPNIGLYQKDGSHPNRQGTYLAAATICARICDIAPEKIPDSLTITNGRGKTVTYEVPAEDAKAIKKAASEAITGEEKRTSDGRQ